MEVLPDKMGLFPDTSSCLTSQPFHLDTTLPPQHYKELGGTRGCVFEEMTADKIGLALPLKGVFVVKMRVTAGGQFAQTQCDLNSPGKKVLKWIWPAVFQWHSILKVESCKFVSGYLWAEKHLHSNKRVLLLICTLLLIVPNVICKEISHHVHLNCIAITSIS